jgi:hypothetical protein
MKNTLLIEKTMMVPYYRGEEINYRNREGFANITIYAADTFRKPCIIYGGLFDSGDVAFTLTYFDRNLVDEANEKGASWLISQLRPAMINLDNYEEIIMEHGYNMSVYEKEYQLGDRDVLAMVIDHILDDGRSLGMYFVYDDIIVCVNGYMEAVETILPDITFREVSLWKIVYLYQIHPPL